MTCADDTAKLRLEIDEIDIALNTLESNRARLLAMLEEVERDCADTRTRRRAKMAALYELEIGR